MKAPVPVICESKGDKFKAFKHPKCKGIIYNTFDGEEFDCDYGTTLLCEECIYGGCGGRKYPQAKCNQ